MENRDYIVAVDLGTNTVTTVVGYKNEVEKLCIVDCAVTNVQGMLRGEIKNIETVAQSVKESVSSLEQRLGIQIVDVYVGVSGTHIKCVKLPYHVFVGGDGEIRPEDVQKLQDGMRNMQASEGEKIIQIIPQNYLIDDHEEVADPVGMFGKKLQATFNFVVGDSSAVSRISRLLSRVELRQKGLFLNAVAAAEAVATPDEKEEGVAIVDIGAGTTDVAIYHENLIRHIGIVPMGGNAINKDIRSYGILERNVENLKVKYGSAVQELAQADKYITTPGLNARTPKEISFQNLAGIIEARMLDIIDLVMAEIKSAGYEGRLPAGVILTGGGAQLAELEVLFKRYTGIDVRVAMPDVQLTAESAEKVNSPQFATAVGLLVKGMNQPKPVRQEQPRTRVTAGITAPEPIKSREEASEPRPTWNDRFKSLKENNAPEEIEEEMDDPQPKKKGLFGKLSDRINSMFDVIDDNEI